ncbi:hypothetical protein BDK51DRAFT_39904 [Blyttiomyces helicus]|uniref:Uncharacterized protein n=1 Tax=Blyttiomyces helicus TaxID=388810 RepID=A0A4P9WQR5_9FUNG|nr:hypothetical protein BDK51DRAFT_39904 [Blyttiomyces helicus]|eukprot:RKO93226.1 hypothetical protein BDK51DRAFT_39904 [Blyttiomyces helicus]
MFTELALTPLSDVDLSERLNLTLGPIEDTDFGMTAELTENLYHPIYNRNHDRPENIFLVTKDGKNVLMQNTSDENMMGARELRFDHILKRLKDKDRGTILHEAAILFKIFNPRFEKNLDNN